MEIVGISVSGEQYFHDFKREQESKFCFICQDSWPINETSVSKFNKCSKCGLSVHSGCRHIAKICYHCEPNMAHKKLTSHDLQQVNCSGKVTVNLVHAYDLPISQGTFLYGIIKISSCHETIRTDMAMMGDHDCVWDIAQQGDGNFRPAHAPSVAKRADGLETSSGDVLHHKVHPDGTPERITPNECDYRRVGTKVFAAPWVYLEIWKSYYGFFDGIAATCKVNMLPLLLYQGVTIERWFGLKDVDGNSSGMVLLRLSFSPEYLVPQGVSPTNSSQLDHPARSNDFTSERGATGLVGTNGVPDPQQGPDHCTEEVVIEKRSKDNLVNKDSDTDSSEHTPLDMSTQQPVLLEVPVVASVGMLGGMASGEVRPRKLSSSGGADATVSEHALSSIDKAKEEGMGAEDSVHRQMLPAEYTETSGIRRRRVLSSNTGSLNSKNSQLHSGQGEESVKISTSTVEVDDADTKKGSAIESESSESVSAPVVAEANPWRRWFEQSASEFVQKASEKTASAIDAISAATSSSAVRKRRRKQGGGRDGGVLGSDGTAVNGVGMVYVNLISAYRANVSDAAEGDTFVVVALSTGIPELDNELEKETHVIKSSATPCYNEKFEFVAPHFRSVLTLTLVDAQTDRKLGVSEISIYAIQQRDADRYSSNWQLAGEEQFKMRDLNGKEQVGHFNAAINFKENTEELFLSSAPKLAMVGPDEAMSLERVRIHISRFGTIISSIRASFDRYKRLMDWENPGFTFAMLVLFVYFTLTIDAEYALCAPLFMAVALLSETWYYRHFGYFRMRWVQSEDDSLQFPFRPVAYLRLAVAGFRHFGHKGEPKDPPPYVRISLLPDAEHKDTLFTPSGGETQEYHIATFSTSTGRSSKDLKEAQTASGVSTLSSGKNTSGIGKFISSFNMTKSDKSVNDALLHNVSDPWQRNPDTMHLEDIEGIIGGRRKDDVDISYIYPILQALYDESAAPLASSEATQTATVDESTNGHNQGSSSSNGKPSTSKSAAGKKLAKPTFVPWRKSTAVVKFTFHGDNPLSSFIDNTWGSVQVPVRDLVDVGVADDVAMTYTEKTVWKPIHWTTAHIQRLRSLSEDDSDFTESSLLGLDHHSSLLSHSFHYEPSSDSKSHHDRNHIDSSTHIRNSASSRQACRPEVLLRMQLDVKQSPKDATEAEIEVSRVVQSLITPRSEKSDSTISAIWNARDHIKYVQNILGGVLNKIESFKNIFNWTHPRKTFPLYAALFLIWIATIIIPGRYLILLVGLSEFLYKFMPQPEDLPMSTRIQNLLESLPNDDDLSQIYREEREANRAVFEGRRKERLKQAKLRLVLDCQWDGAVKIKHSVASAGAHKASVWNPCFLVVQGHRLVWWDNEEDIDEGNAPTGELLLQGHAGTTHASPVDIKEMGSDHRLVVVFGRDAAGNQLKRTILTSDAEACLMLKTVINKVLGIQSPEGL